MKARLTKISSSHNNLRSDVIEGVLAFEPEVGKVIVMYSPGLVDPELYTRVLRTSRVQKIEGDLYHTRNSTYRIEKLS